MATTQRVLDASEIRKQFPFFQPHPEMRSLIYLDNAATTHKPYSVIEAVSHFWAHYNANVHRGAYGVGAKASELYEGARARVAQFLNAREMAEIIFTRGTTESINLVAYAWGRSQLKPGDEIILTEMEHHANLIPWLRVAQETGAKVVVWSITDEGRLELETLKSLLSERTRMVAVTHVSNVLGTVNPVAEICRLAHEAGALCLVDGAQSVAHMPVDVQAIGCDFFAFSGHKAYGPTGIGVLYGRREVLENLPPFMTGGGMIRSVNWDRIDWAEIPMRFEAGTPPIAEAVGLHAALDFIDSLGREQIEAYEHELTQYALERLQEVPGLKLYGPQPDRAGIFAFTLEDIHPHDIATILDSRDIAIRSGMHCAHPLGDRLGQKSTARASLAVYNDTEHIDRLVEGLHYVRQVFGYAG
ncbi:MAG: cysteine desulfurase [Fimbriimonadales bacterium]|nr:cysteine desulfurase [Armatimonadota bacterium]MCX7688303.1 cysteine desulfurase [Fimbriimonadales bacterium]CUU38159.1 cysteine desulfurase / selenocysteine lyase [Armatimonadetes bacterium DC]